MTEPPAEPKASTIPGVRTKPPINLNFLMPGETPKTTIHELLPRDEIRKLAARASWCNPFEDSFCINLYNGSNWTVNEIAVTIAAKNDDGSPKWERRFDHKYLDIPPFSTKETFIDTPGTARKFSWRIIEAKGIRSE